MKVTVIGEGREDGIKRLESLLKTEAVRVRIEGEHPIINVARESYGNNKRKNVVFDKCVTEFLDDSLEETLYDVYEQIALNSLEFLDMVFVITEGMDDETAESYKTYSEMFPGKFRFVKNADEIVL